MRGISRASPVGGLLLGDSPTVYVDLLEATTALIPANGSAFFSEDWSAVTLSSKRRVGQQIETAITLPSGKCVQLAGAYWIHTSTAEQVVAVPERPGRDGLFMLLVLDAAGETRFPLQTREPEWIASSASGHLLAVGTRSGTRVFGDGGQEVCALAGPSDLGALSEHHVAIQRPTSSGLELVVRALSPAGSERAFPVSRGSSLRFDSSGAHLAHVSAAQWLLLDLGASEPQVLRRRPSAPDRPWRDVAFDHQGNLATSWIHIEQEPTETEDGERPGLAMVGIELVPVRPPPGAGPPLDRNWKVDDWSARAPRLNFDAANRLYAIVGCRAYQVLP